MNAPHHRSAKLVSTSDRQELSLEHIDLLARKCHHLHDEKIAGMISGFFVKVSRFFQKSHYPSHQPVK